MNRRSWAVFLAVFLSGVTAMPAYAVKLKDTDIDFGIQYRVMYNNSNIQSDDQYDFFRQRLRLNMDVKTEEGVGGFMQLEFRGGWGGSSPAFSDPRDTYAVNAGNRLQARGVRYGYLHFPLGPGTIMAGLVPLNDQVDQMLFSADWDFNVGGVTYAGKTGGLDYRLAYVRLVEGAFYRNTAQEDKDQNFFIGDLNTDLGNTNVGVHYYGTYGKICPGSDPDCGTPGAAPADFEKLNQTWAGPHATVKLEPLTLHAAALFNDGKRAAAGTDGFLGRIEASVKLGKSALSLLGVYTSGETNGTGFQTIQDIFGTSGYWAYTYIFTPHGPSDVNDFGLKVGNKGFGLTTVQGKIDVPLGNKVSGQIVAGLFRSNENMGTAGQDLGTEVGAQLAVNAGKHMNLEFGAAIANLGDAGKAEYNAPSTKDSVNEVFTRLQLEY